MQGQEGRLDLSASPRASALFAASGVRHVGTVIFLRARGAAAGMGVGVAVTASVSPSLGAANLQGLDGLGHVSAALFATHTHFRERRASVRAKGNGLFPRAQAPPPASCFWELRVLKCEAPRQGVGDGVGLVTWGICPCSASYLLCGSGQVTRPP